jgi:hypothetical protein
LAAVVLLDRTVQLVIRPPERAERRSAREWRCEGREITT